MELSRLAWLISLILIALLAGCTSSEQKVSLDEIWNHTTASLNKVSACQYHEYIKVSSGKEAWIKGEYDFSSKNERIIKIDGDNISMSLSKIFDLIQKSKNKELIGEEEIRLVKKRSCWVVKVTSNNSEMKIWIDKESYLPIRIKFEENDKNQNLSMQRAIDLFDYKT